MAWAVSAMFHGVLGALVVLFVGQIKPILQEHVFTWKVALVQSFDSNPTTARAESPANSLKPSSPFRSAQPAELSSDVVLNAVAPRQSAQMVHPVVEPPTPIEPTTERQQPKVDPVQRSVEQNVEAVKLQAESPRTIEPPVEQPQPNIEPVRPSVEQRAEAVKPQAEPTVQPVLRTREPEAARHAESVAVQSQSVGAGITSQTAEVSHSSQVPAEPVPAAPAHEETVAHHESPAPGLHKSVAPAAESAPTPSDGGVQVAKATALGSDPKGDHRWLAESLWRRVAELKQYPQSARVNGEEGKVILKAVIRSDGYLADVAVHKSSGHAILDSAALEAVRLAFPLPMKHSLGKPEIVVTLPIVYSLSN